MSPSRRRAIDTVKTLRDTHAHRATQLRTSLVAAAAAAPAPHDLVTAAFLSVGADVVRAEVGYHDARVEDFELVLAELHRGR